MSGIAGVAGGDSSIRNPTVVRYTISVVDTEEALVLPSGTQRYRMMNVGSRFVKLGYAAGSILAGSYITLIPYCPLPSLGIIGQNSLTVYLQSKGLETIEFEIWR